MSTKPSSVPTWDSTLANVSAITGGHASNGFLANAKPTSGELNTLFNSYATWIQYLSDGNFSGAATFLSTLGITGLLTVSGGASVPTGQNITLVGTADLKHPSRSLMLPAVGPMASGMTFDATTPTLLATNSAASAIYIPIPLKVGDRVLSIDFNRKGNASAYTQVAAIQKVSAAGVVSIVQSAGSVATPTGAVWTVQNVAVGSPVAIAAGEQWFASWQPNAVVQSLQGISVNYDRP